MIGISGTPIGMTEDDWADGGPVPFWFCACTVNVYGIPFARFCIFTGENVDVPG